MAKIDYDYKSYVLREHSDLLLQTKRASLRDYCETQLEYFGVVPDFLARFKDTKNSYDLFKFCEDNNLLKEYKECKKINHSSFERTKRLKDRIEKMLKSGPCLFLTLTFSDTTLQTSTLKQRRVMVSRYLKTFNARYVANIDYGKLNHREHYHAIIATDKVDYMLWRKYGSINGEKIRNKDITSDKTKLAKYICKLSNHAIKETTKRSVLIYSR